MCSLSLLKINLLFHLLRKYYCMPALAFSEDVGTRSCEYRTRAVVAGACGILLCARAWVPPCDLSQEACRKVAARPFYLEGGVTNTTAGGSEPEAVTAAHTVSQCSTRPTD